FLELAEAESGYGLRVFALPHGHILATVIALGNKDASCRHLHSLGNAEGHVIQRIFSKTKARIVRIPILTGYREIVPAALVSHCVFSAVGSRDGDFFLSLEWCGQNDRKVAVVVFVLLNEGKRLSVHGYTLHPQGPEQVERHDPHSVASRHQIGRGLPGEGSILFECYVQLLMFNPRQPANAAALVLAAKIERGPFSPFVLIVSPEVDLRRSPVRIDLIDLLVVVALAVDEGIEQPSRLGA